MLCSRFSSRPAADKNACHHSSGDCSAPPSDVRMRRTGSISHPSTRPLTVISATFIPEVPRSTERTVGSVMRVLSQLQFDHNSRILFHQGETCFTRGGH